jgi:acetylornithine deacetylase
MTTLDSVDSAAAIKLISDLVRIDSVTPELVEGGAGEREVAEFMAAWLADLPVDVVIDDVGSGHVNLLATLKGSGGGPRLCINAHADTVGYAGWPDEALVPRLDGDRLFGLGAADDKGCCAIGLLALRELATNYPKLKGDLVVACVADEEGISLGTEHLVKNLSADAAIVLEADQLPKIVVEHQGFGWLDIIFHGRAAHGSAPGAGVDAIVGMAKAMERLHQWDLEHFAKTEGSFNGRTVFHTGTVQGGTDYATYPSKCVVGVEIGTQPGETLATRVAEIDAILEQTCQELPGLSAEVNVHLDRNPFVAEGHERLLECLQSAAREHLGEPLEPVGLNAWADSGLMQEAGIPTVMFGPLGGNFHAPGEWVSIPEVVSTVNIVTAAAAAYLE